MTSFDTYDFSADAQWRSVESNMYIPPGPDHDALLTKRKRRFYRDNVDPDYSWTDPPLSTASSNSSSSSQSTPPPPFQSFKSHQPAEASASSSSSSSASSASSGSSAPRNNAGLSVGGYSVSVLLSYTQLCLHVLSLLCFPFVLLPFLAPSLSYSAFSLCLYASSGAYLLQLLKQQGVPRLSKEFAMSLLADVYFHHLFYAFICLAAPPNSVYLLPFVLRSALFCAGAFSRLLPTYAPALAVKVVPYLTQLTANAGELNRTAALMEICAFFYTVALLITPARSLMLVFLYYQFLRLRYLMSDDSRHAWGVVKMQLDRVVYSPMCPAVVKGGYEKLKSMLWARIDPQQAGGILPRCAIM